MTEVVELLEGTITTMDRHTSETRKSLNEILRDKRIAAGLAIGVGVAALTGCAPGAESEPKPTQTQSVEAETPPVEATPAPEQSTSPEVSLEEQIEALKIPAGLSNEELAEAYIDISNKWWVAGAEEGLSKDRVEANLTWDEFIPQIAVENTALYAPALYGPDWATNPNIQDVLMAKIDANVNLLTNYTATAWNTENPENKEAYTSWMDVEKVTLVTEDENSRTLVITYNNYDNAEQNAVTDGALMKSGAVEIVFTEVDGKEVVTSSHS